MENNQTLRNLSPQELGEYIYIIKKQGKSFDEIRSELLASGITAEEFKNAIDSYNDEKQAAKEGKKLSLMTKGVLWVTGSFIIMLILRLVGLGGLGILTLVPMGFGIIEFLMGLYNAISSAEKRDIN